MKRPTPSPSPTPTCATSPGALLVVSLHDVAPGTEQATRSWLADLDERDVPATLLLVPGPWQGPALTEAPAFVGRLHDAAGRGHELALHGLTHQRVPGGTLLRQAVNQVLARGCAEFCALDQEAARHRLDTGLAMLRRAGITPTGFTPPGWLASPAAVRALREAGLDYTTSHLAVHDLRTGARHRMPALSHRPGGAGERFGAHLMRTAARRWARTRQPFRIALHPADLDRPGLRQAALDALDTALAAGARPLTYTALVAHHRQTAGDR